jgi:hypothetical protein
MSEADKKSVYEHAENGNYTELKEALQQYSSKEEWVYEITNILNK